MNRKNLIKLADYLDQLPEDYRQFFMGDFYIANVTRDEIIQYQSDPTFNLCGSAACAVGHAPQAGIKVDESTFTAQIRDGYASDVWDAYTFAAFGVKMDTPEFEFMFGGGWSEYDNTPKGAAARIRYVVNNNDIPPITDYDGEDRPFDSYEMRYTDPRVNIIPLYEEYLA